MRARRKAGKNAWVWEPRVNPGSEPPTGERRQASQMFTGTKTAAADAHAAGAIEAYQTRSNITGTETIGAEPTNPEQRDHWHKTFAIVGAAGFLTPDARREPGGEESSLATEWASIRTVDRSHARELAGEEREPPTPSRGHDHDSGSDRGYDNGFGL